MSTIDLFARGPRAVALADAVEAGLGRRCDAEPAPAGPTSLHERDGAERLRLPDEASPVQLRAALAAALGPLRAPTLSTARLVLRPWRPDDRAPFAALNADPEVMEHFPTTLSREESDGLVDRLEAAFARQGFGAWVVEVPGAIACAGFVGLGVPSFEAAFTPCVEVGWRLVRAAWGHGYAQEAARAALEHGFGTVGLREIVAFTTPSNVRSQRVMRAIGMVQTGEFDHPRVPEGPLRRHVLFSARAGAATEAPWDAAFAERAWEQLRPRLSPWVRATVAGVEHSGPDAVLTALADEARRTGTTPPRAPRAHDARGRVTAL